MTKVTIIGVGRVGLATGVAFATLGHDVICYDIDSDRVKSIQKGKQPFHESGLSEALEKVLDTGKFTATDNSKKALTQSKFFFICVGTPALPDGSMDSNFLGQASSTIGRELRNRNDYPIVVVKSTVLPGTTENIIIPSIMKESKFLKDSFGICVNPEFLREGFALYDSMKPDRIVIGSNDDRTGNLLEEFYADFECKKWRCDLRTAEMVKYATNSFLATKVSFANEIANICEIFSINSDKVLEGMALDSRINPKYLIPGVGFGGSCLLKDVKAIVSAVKSQGYDSLLLDTVLNFNERQALRAVDLLLKQFDSLKGKHITVLGLSFKPETDDIRDSRAIPIIQELLKHKAIVTVHDPVASVTEITEILPVKTASSIKDALEKADGCIIQTSWQEYKTLTKSDFSVMKKVVVIDGRRTLSPHNLPEGAIYKRIG